MKTETEALAKERSDRLRLVINKHFINQRQFAKSIGMSVNTINHYTQGRRFIGDKLAVSLEMKSGIRAEYLLNGTGEMLNHKVLHSKLPTYLLTFAGLSEEVFESGKIDLFKFLTNNLTCPAVILATSKQFCISNNTQGL